MTTLKLEEKTITSGMISLEQKDAEAPIYLLHRSFAGSIHFTSFVFPKSSKVKVIDKLTVKVQVSVYQDKDEKETAKYQPEHVEITFVRE